MATFGYIVIDKFGKEVKGSLESESEEKARHELKKAGNTIVEVQEQGVLQKDIKFEFGGKPKPRDMSVYCRQFVSMLKAGVTIIDALKMLTEQTENKNLKTATNAVRASIEKGETLAGSMAKFPQVFPPLMIHMVSAGEASGNLEVALDRMGTQFEKSAKIRSLVGKAMIYPIAVMVVAIAVVIVMLVAVIPNYADMFEDLGTELPAITKAVQAMSNFIIDWWFILIPIIAGIVFVIWTFAKTDSGKHIFGKLAIKIPIFGELTTKSASSMAARTLSTLLAAGVSLNESVEIAAGTMSNVWFKEALMAAKDEVMIGVPLSKPVELCGLFPPMFYHMVRIGEEAGNLEEMLEKIADYYDEEVEMAVQSLLAVMEPLIIVVLAAIVIPLVGACLAPMMTMYESLNSM